MHRVPSIDVILLVSAVKLFVKAVRRVIVIDVILTGTIQRYFQIECVSKIFQLNANHLQRHALAMVGNNHSDVSRSARSAPRLRVKINFAPSPHIIIQKQRNTKNPPEFECAKKEFPCLRRTDFSDRNHELWILKFKYSQLVIPLYNSGFVIPLCNRFLCADFVCPASTGLVVESHKKEKIQIITATKA